MLTRLNNWFIVLCIALALVMGLLPMPLWAQTPLKQSTDVTVKVGPLYKTDGTVMTTLTVTNANVKLAKNGGDFAAKNDADNLVHDEQGIYDCNMDATDTATLGNLAMVIIDSNDDYMPKRHDFVVYPANVYDSLFSTDKLQVDVNQLVGETITAASAGYFPSTVKVGTGTGELNITSGVVDANVTHLDGNDQSLADLKDFADNGYDPENNGTNVYTVRGAEPISSTRFDALDANFVTVKATQDTHTTSLTNIDANTALIVADSNELQTDWANGGRLDLIIDAILTDTAAMDTYAEMGALVWNSATDRTLTHFDEDDMTIDINNTTIGRLYELDEDTTIIDLDSTTVTATPAYVLNTTIASATSASVFTLTAGKQSTNAYLYHVIAVTDADDSNTEQRVIVGYTSDRLCLVDQPFSFTPAASDVARIIYGAYFKPTNTGVLR